MVPPPIVMKEFKKTLIYLAVAALVGVGVYINNRLTPASTEEKKPKVFPNFVADDIRTITLENLGTTLTAEKSPIVIEKDDKDVWHITSPKQFLADDSTLRSLLTGVGDFTSDFVIDKPSNLKDFGLDPPAARCTLKAKNGTSFEVLVGGKDMTGSSVYIKSPDKNSIYMVGSYSADNLHKSLNDYRDHTFLKTDPVVAKKIQVTRDGKTTVFEKDKDNNWFMTQPLQAKADSSKIRGLLTTISSLHIQDFVADQPANLSSYGLSAPRLRMEVWPSDGGPTRSILVGKKLGKTPNLYAKDGDQSFVCTVGEYIYNSMDLKASDYRDKTILQFDGGAVKSLTVREGARTFVYDKNEKGEWTCTGRPNAATEAIALVNQLSGITISDFPDPKTPTGLSSPTIIIEVSLVKGGNRVFRFGKRDKGSVFLSVDSDKDVYQVPDAVISQMESYYNNILTSVPVASPFPSPKK